MVFIPLVDFQKLVEPLVPSVIYSHKISIKSQFTDSSKSGRSAGFLVSALQGSGGHRSEYPTRPCTEHWGSRSVEQEGSWKKTPSHLRENITQIKLVFIVVCSESTKKTNSPMTHASACNILDISLLQQARETCFNVTVSVYTKRCERPWLASTPYNTFGINSSCVWELWNTLFNNHLWI